ncbi:asparagine synthase (glutamine-hydrolyzing) [Microscilla marina]|uniref:asparagine synthase (glutamine-hydrolyzing) n=1 Tax=Microscilla marina ATCC 23134 TaxID=313606 RepID=A1ZXW4_MICM2|nr:asparagine synthase (glutamine-hydrolyzing) [Microscilla marina]EAY24793.1 probable asparagine synthase, glutamine-hydrolyzing, putative [Microscilla marina ATCC 23134]
MSGIAGFFSPNTFFSETDLQQMAAPLQKRGAQSSHHYYEEGLGLIHQRLSFVDKSPEAQQPMQSHNGRFVMVMDGQAYNHHEIARGFSNEQFNTTSDAEIILENFVEKNIRSIYQINGMFAAATYDREEKVLSLFRDRVGIKPLFYYWDEENFAFASELHALLKLPQIKRRLNKKAVAEFLHLGYIPAPHTLYKHIFKLEPGSWLRIQDKNLIVKKYWTVADKIYEPKLRSRLPYLNTEANALKHFEKILLESLEQRTPTTATYGTWLDHHPESCLLTALLAKQKGNDFPTLSVAYPKTKNNEPRNAVKVAEHLKTNHEEISVSFDDIRSFVNSLPEKFQEPVADFNQFTYTLLGQKSKEVAEVIMTAQGADALFFGNGTHHWAQRLDSSWIKTIRKPYAYLLKINKSTKARKASALLNYSHKDDLLSHVYSQEHLLFSKRELPSLLSSYTPISPYPVIDDASLTPLEQQALFDINYDLPGNSLFLLDQALMSNTVEARTPLLDFRIIEFAINLNPQLKYRGAQPKYLVKQLLQKFVPEKLWAKQKLEQTPMLAQWMEKELDDYLNEKIVKECGVVEFEVVQQLKEQFKKGHTYLYNRLWALTILHVFLSNAIAQGMEVE